MRCTYALALFLCTRTHQRVAREGGRRALEPRDVGRGDLWSDSQAGLLVYRGDGDHPSGQRPVLVHAACVGSIVPDAVALWLAGCSDVGISRETRRRFSRQFQGAQPRTACNRSVQTPILLAEDVHVLSHWTLSVKDSQRTASAPRRLQKSAAAQARTAKQRAEGLISYFLFGRGAHLEARRPHLGSCWLLR